MTLPPEPIHLLLEPHPVFGVLHPVAHTAPEQAVLIVPPFGWEDMTSYRARRAWAQQLADAGRPALRIDLPGTGDSGGSARDDGLAEAWTGAVTAAVAWLRERTGARRVGVAGIGLGGLIATHALGTGAPIDDLVLWGVPAHGRALVRELRAFSRMEASGYAAQGAPPDAGVPEGGLAAAGYLLTAAARAALEAIDLTALGPLPGPARRVLLLDRDGVAVDPALHAALESAGAEVTCAPGPGYGRIVVGDLQRVEIPTDTFAAADAWLAEGDGRVPAPAAAPVPAEAAGGIELDTADGRIRETPLVIDGSAGALVGVLAEPCDSEPELCLVLLNAGPQRRTGPNRMWVELARRWAGRGVAALRVDSAGIGDSDGVPAGWEQESLLYAPERLADVRAVLDALERRGLPPRFVLLGLCSGANWAFHSAQLDPRVVGGILLNPRALFWSRWRERGHDATRARRLAAAGTWRRILTGDMPPRRALQAAIAVARWALLSALRRARGLRHAPGAPDQLTAALARLHDGGKRLVLVFTDREPLRAELEASGQLQALADAPHVDLHLVPSVAEAHTLPLLWLQEEVCDIVDGAMLRFAQRGED